MVVRVELPPTHVEYDFVIRTEVSNYSNLEPTKTQEMLKTMTSLNRNTHLFIVVDLWK